jgi:hypothetical protein
MNQVNDSVMMDGYTINQKTSGLRHETEVSKITVDFKMMSADTHSLKHEKFIADLREFLTLRNSGHFSPNS